MKENNSDKHNEIEQNKENNIKNNDIIENNNIQNESNITNNTDIINESQNNNDNIINNEINISNNSDGNNNTNNITNENTENINNSIVNDSVDLDEEEIAEEKFNPTFTFSFKLFFILNSLSYYYTYYTSNKLKYFSLCLWTIINKNQYYRLISSHFCYKGFLDYFLSMLGFFYLTKYLERQIGSIYLILFVFHAMIITSILFLGFMWLFKFMLMSCSFNFIEQGSFSGVDFCLYLSYFLLKKNRSANINILNSLDFKGVYLVYLTMLLIQFLSPTSMFFLNISGTLAAFLIFALLKSFTLPKNKWVNDIEKLINLDNPKSVVKNILGYYSLNDNENIIENVKEFDYFG